MSVVLLGDLDPTTPSTRFSSRNYSSNWITDGCKVLRPIYGDEGGPPLDFQKKRCLFDFVQVQWVDPLTVRVVPHIYSMVFCYLFGCLFVPQHTYTFTIYVPGVES